MNEWYSSGAAGGSDALPESTENCVKWMSSLASDNFDELNKTLNRVVTEGVEEGGDGGRVVGGRTGAACLPADRK